MERFKTWFLAWARRLYDRLCPTVPAVETASEAAQFAKRHALPAWSVADEEKERALYLTNRTAFWLRPDRHAHGVPCWMVEGEWEAPETGLWAAPRFGQLTQGPALADQYNSPTWWAGTTCSTSWAYSQQQAAQNVSGLAQAQLQHSAQNQQLNQFRSLALGSFAKLLGQIR